MIPTFFIASSCGTGLSKNLHLDTSVLSPVEAERMALRPRRHVAVSVRLKIISVPQPFADLEGSCNNSPPPRGDLKIPKT